MDKDQFSHNPVLLFCYNRKLLLKSAVERLSNNVGADKTDLFIFSDGPKKPSDISIILELRDFLKSIKGFKSITIEESKTNKGLAKSVIAGVSKVLETYDAVIVLEDDLLTSENFLLYMNQCLNLYENNDKVFSISGYSPPIKPKSGYNYDSYFFVRNSSHGWATWKNRWEKVDWQVSDFDSFIASKNKQAEFNNGGSDLSRMLFRQMNGKINSWSIRFCYQQYKTGTYTVYPVVSKIQNLGFGPDATHTNNFNRFHTNLDDGSKTNFVLPRGVILDKTITVEFKKFYSLRSRGFGKIKTYLYKAGLIENR